MNTTLALDIAISPEIRAWAEKKLSEDKAYIEQRAQFAPEPIKSIAKLILAAGQGAEE